MDDEIPAVVVEDADVELPVEVIQSLTDAIDSLHESNRFGICL